jgi:ribosomal protein L37E
MEDEELREFLRERSANSECEVCGYESWIQAEKPLKIPAIDEDSSLHIDFALVCMRCGNVRFHALADYRDEFGRPANIQDPPAE